MIIDHVSKQKKEEYIKQSVKEYNDYRYFRDFDPPIKLVEFDKLTKETLGKLGFLKFLNDLEKKNVFVKLIKDREKYVFTEFNNGKVSFKEYAYPIYYCDVFYFTDKEMKHDSLREYAEKKQVNAMLTAIYVLQNNPEYKDFEKIGVKVVNQKPDYRDEDYYNNFLLKNQNCEMEQ